MGSRESLGNTISDHNFCAVLPGNVLQASEKARGEAFFFQPSRGVCPVEHMEIHEAVL